MVFCDLVLFFSIYSFLGWLLETIYQSIIEGKFIRRGFLAGCFCPIYGASAVMIIKIYIGANSVFINRYMVLTITIIFSIVTTTLLEYTTGYIMDKVFNLKWWDYSDERANIQGFVCLKYSFVWGILALIIILKVHSLVLEGVACIPASIKKSMPIGIIVYFMTDFILSSIKSMSLSNVIPNNSDEKTIHYKM